MRHNLTLELDERHRERLVPLLKAVIALDSLSPKQLNQLQRRFPPPDGGMYSRNRVAPTIT